MRQNKVSLIIKETRMYTCESQAVSK